MCTMIASSSQRRVCQELHRWKQHIPGCVRRSSPGRCFSTIPKRWTSENLEWTTPPSFTAASLHPQYTPQDARTHFDAIQTAYSKPQSVLLTLPEMIRRIPRAVQIRKQQGIPVGDKTDPILQLLSGLNQRTIQEELRPYCFPDPSVPYTRNLIATDHVSYTLLALCWSVDQCSPIHDHPGDGCYMRVIDGAIFEKRFRIQSSQLVCTAHQVYTSNQLAFIHDVMGLHQIGCHNSSSLWSGNRHLVTAQPAVSLHLYTPPIQHCHVFSSAAVGETGVQIRDSGPMTHYSEYGRRKSFT